MDSLPRLRDATPGDAPAISAIYNHYVEHDTCTYQEQPETIAERLAWLAAHRPPHVAIVAEDADGGIAGWASLSRFRERSAYRFTAENSIYLRSDRRGQGLGTRLMTRLMASAREGGFRTIIAGISAEQTASIALHRRFGFVEVARLREVGWKFGRWLDVISMQAMVMGSDQGRLDPRGDQGA